MPKTRIILPAVEITLTEAQAAGLQQLNRARCFPNANRWLYLHPTVARNLADQGLVTFKERQLRSGRMEYSGSQITHLGMVFIEHMLQRELAAA